MRKIFAAAGIIGALGIAGAAFAQTTLPEGVTEEQMNSALKDLSEVYGAPIVRVDQAKAICNEEQYVTECAQIGKKHDLFSDERTKQVDTLLNELKGDAVEKLKKCEDVSCLVDVANSIAGRLNSQNPTIAKAVELTPQKVKEKQTIVDTAKTLGVDFEACRTMDPDTASIELLRGCARLAKHENVQKYIPQETRDRAEEADASIALKENLESGKISCGDNTLDGCGNFCLSPSAEMREKGVEAIPPVCKQIAKQFFGENGVKELERAYTNVRDTFDTLTDKARSVVFKTIDGKTLTDPASIGRYMEEAGSRGDVEAVSGGMDFLVAKGFVTPKDREFALSMVRKVNERGPIDFGACRTDPSKCADLVSEEDRGQFTAMGEIEKVMKSEMSKRGVSDPSMCSSDPSVGKSCLEAARAALPQIEKLAGSLPQAQGIVSDIRQKIRFGEAGLEARSRVEERFKSEGDFSIGEQRFGSIPELDSFCRFNPQQCLSETAREGIFSKDIAAEKYEYVIDARYGPMPPGPAPQGQVDMRNVSPQFPSGFNKEEALQQFKQWLDNPENAQQQRSGPEGVYPAPYPAPYPSQYQQYPQYSQYPTPYSPYQRPTIDQNRCQYATAMPIPCKAGEYRQESRNEFGCPVFGSCIPFDTKTEPPRTDGRNICPALATVESCPAGEEKTITFSSPECGTYYSCRGVSRPPTPFDDPNRTTSNCERYGSGWRMMDSSGNCFSPSGTEYRTISGALNSCASAPVYGCSSSDVPPSVVPPYPAPTGQREQIWNSFGLRSWVRSDAEQSRIDSLKQACANVSSRADIWLPNAGTQSSPDFGMPDPAKCSRAAQCSETQSFNGSECVSETTDTNQQRSCGLNEYWNGSSCVTSTTQTSCPSGQYWSGSSCVSSTQTNTNTTATGSCSSELIGLLGSGCHSMGSGWFNEEMTSYVTSGSQTVRNCATEPVSGCSVGNYNQTQTAQTQTYCPSGQYVNGACVYSSPATSCPSGQYWNGSSCVQTSTTDCPSGQYWNGSACVSSTQSTTGAYDSASAQQGCSNAGGTWDSSANYCRMPTQSTSCQSGQYWNGSACQSSDSTYTAPAYTPPPDSTYTPPPESTYTPPPPTESYTPPPAESSPPPPTESYTPPPAESSPPPTTSEPVAYVFCPEGHDWNGAYCALSPLSPFERYTANVLSAFRSLLGL